MSDMKTVFDTAPYNNHSMKCIASLESFTRTISGILMYSFIEEGVSMHKENKSISQPGIFTAIRTVSESVQGMSHHICDVTLIVEGRVIDSTLNETIVKVVGK